MIFMELQLGLWFHGIAIRPVDKIKIKKFLKIKQFTINRIITKMTSYLAQSKEEFQLQKLE